MTAWTWLFTRLWGEPVGTDSFGNRYYRDKRTRGQRRERRWVVYKGRAEGSAVPAQWNAWLHRTVVEAPRPEATPPRPWQKPHVPNLTGTAQAYRPPGHTLSGGQRPRASGEYEPWVPS